MSEGTSETKPPVVIELTTSFRTGMTSLVGASSVPCPRCRSQKTVFDKSTGEVICQGEGCGTKTKLT